MVKSIPAFFICKQAMKNIFKFMVVKTPKIPLYIMVKEESGN